MRICGPFTCWTDYPIEQLGDVAGKEAPIRHVKVLAHDGNKYALVRIIGTDVTATFKGGYLYRQKGRYGQVKAVSYRKLQRMAGVVTQRNFWTSLHAASQGEQS